MDVPKEKLESAVDLIGESWLKEQIEKDERRSSEDEVSYGVPTSREEPPPVAKAYRLAKEDLRGEQTEALNLPEWRNESLEFLRLGQVYEMVRDSPIVDPDGNEVDSPTVQELFQERLRSRNEFESSRYELEVAAAYKELGHNPAFVKEDESAEQTPDIELIDLKPTVQVECKHCRKQSEEERKQSNRANILFENIRTRLPNASYIVVLDLNRTPTKTEIENVAGQLPSTNKIKSTRKSVVTLPFGDLTILSLPFEEPILHPIYNTNSFEIMTTFYDDVIRPVVEGSLGLDKEFEDFGNSVLLFEAQRRKTTLLIRRVTFISIKESTWGSNVYQRLRNQFKNVSGKFDDRPAVLHIDYPKMNEGDTLQEINLRNHAGGALKIRDQLSGVVVSGLIHNPVFSDELITRRRIHIPHYDPNYQLPDDYGPLEGISDNGVNLDQLMKNNIREDLLKDPDGGRKAISQEEGSLSFRFKPNEPRPTEEPKFIINETSMDGETKLKLEITPEEKIQLKYVDLKTGYWTCDVDISDIPEYDPMRIFIVWSIEKVGLSVGHESDEELRQERAKEPLANVEKKDGMLEISGPIN